MKKIILAFMGTVLTDSLGHTYHGDHAYVFYQKSGLKTDNYVVFPYI